MYPTHHSTLHLSVLPGRETTRLELVKGYTVSAHAKKLFDEYDFLDNDVLGSVR